MLFRTSHTWSYYVALYLCMGVFGVASSVLITLPVQAQAVEICNNGIDDDGDKLIDC